jgi:dTDP-4-amino-4,6-dideoxygalactose transaminase
MVAACLASTYVSSIGPFVTEFEDQFAEKLGVRHAVACASGTSAIHLALLALGVGAGDEVLVSDLTFIASGNPIRYCGSQPVLVDSEESTWNLDPDLVVGELEGRRATHRSQPAAVLAVDLLGHPADLSPILKSAAEHGIPVVEDAAESIGASWSGRHPLAGRAAGTAATIGCFSFNGNKLITTGGGGMLVTDDVELARRARHLSTQAKLAGFAYRHDEVGYNYRLTNLAASLGLAQLGRIDELVERKRRLAGRYDEALAGVDGVETPPKAPWAMRSAWLYTVLLPDQTTRDRVCTFLNDAAIEARPIWLPLRRQPPYRSASIIGGDVAINLSERGLSLPSSVGLSSADQERVVDTLVSALGKCGS